MRMTRQEREDFLAAVRIGVLSVAQPGRGPLTIPVWYDYADGKVLITSAEGAVKNDLLSTAGRASLCVHNDTAPYSYVTVEGPVTLTQRSPADVESMAIRYLGHDGGRAYAKGITWGGVLAVLTPEHWLSTDYAKDAAS